MSWSTADIPDLTGRTTLVTGGNSGLGLETAMALAAHGAHVVVASRNPAKGAAAVEHIRAIAAGSSVEQSTLDLADRSSIGSFVNRFMELHDSLDILVNNAGIMMTPESTTVDGYESQLGTNHIGHFVLTAQLLPLLEAAPAARVVTVSSDAHQGGTLDFEDMMFTTPGTYTPFGAYRRSKLANLMFAYELQRRLMASNATSISLAAHPGLAKTNLFNHYYNKVWVRLVRPLAELLVQSAAGGALPSLRAAVDPSATGGEYYGPSKRRGTSGPPVVVGSADLSQDTEVAARLWLWSEQVTGVRFLSEGG